MADVAFGGVGGRAMGTQGIVSPFDIADLSIIGVASIPGEASDASCAASGRPPTR